jgi:hypothetical protein
MEKASLDSWSTVRQHLDLHAPEEISALLDSAQLAFDGNFTLSAPLSVYSQLCQLYPLLETSVQDLTGAHLFLALEPSVPMGTDDDSLELSLGAASLTEAILAPESIAAVPAYLLRFVPYVGSGAVLIATALRQAFYRSSRERGGDALYPKQSDRVRINVRAILGSLGGCISRAKFFRIFQEGRMDFFVRREPASHRMVQGQLRREATTYVYRGLLLTPGDAFDLRNYLQKQGFAERPLETLQLALDTPRDQILQFPYRLAQDNDPNTASSVTDVVLSLLDGKKPSAALLSLADKLALQLIRPEAFLAVPWYWFRKVLPEMGDDLGVLYLMARNCCYIDWARGRDRNQFWVQGGLSTLQGWIGNETLPKRLPHAQPSKRGRKRQKTVKEASSYTRNWRDANRDAARGYLLRQATRAGKDEPDWQLKVGPVSLTPQDEALRQALQAWLLEPDRSLREALACFAQNQTLQQALERAAHLDQKHICHFETLKTEGICQFETFDEGLISHYETLAIALNSYFETLIEAGICHFATIIKILKRIKNSFLEPQDILPSLYSPQQRTEKRKDWDYQFFLAQISPVLSERIRSEKLEERFLAELIAAALNPQVNAPLSMAVSKTLQQNQSTPQAAIDLAALGPQGLHSLVGQVLDRLRSGYLGSFAVGGKTALSQLLKDSIGSAAQIRMLERLQETLFPEP